MLKRFLFFFYLFSVVFPIFSATQRQSDSGSSLLGKQSVKFRDSTVSIAYRESTVDD